MKIKHPLLILGLSVLFTFTFIYWFVTWHEPSFTTELTTRNYRKFTKITTEPADVNINGITDAVIEDENDVVSVAKKISSDKRTVLVTMVNDAYLPFTYSWLCNTKEMGIHKSVLFITTDKTSKERLTKDWPEVSVVYMDTGPINGHQVYSHVGYVKIMIKRTEMLLSILLADIEIFLFEVDCLWLANPVPDLQKITGFDLLVNPVSDRDVFAGGFIWLYATNKTKALWKELTEEMEALGSRIEHKSSSDAVSEAENDQNFFSNLVNKRYANVSVKVLPLDVYADGKWYKLPEEKRKQSRPVVINNNWVLGNEAKIVRAKKWKHWFIDEKFRCITDLVKQVVYT